MASKFCRTWFLSALVLSVPVWAHAKDANVTISLRPTDLRQVTVRDEHGQDVVYGLSDRVSSMTLYRNEILRGGDTTMCDPWIGDLAERLEFRAELTEEWKDGKKTVYEKPLPRVVHVPAKSRVFGRCQAGARVLDAISIDAPEHFRIKVGRPEALAELDRQDAAEDAEEAKREAVANQAIQLFALDVAAGKWELAREHGFKAHQVEKTEEQGRRFAEITESMPEGERPMNVSSKVFEQAMGIKLSTLSIAAFKEKVTALSKEPAKAKTVPVIRSLGRIFDDGSFQDLVFRTELDAQIVSTQIQSLLADPADDQVRIKAIEEALLDLDLVSTRGDATDVQVGRAKWAATQAKTLKGHVPDESFERLGFGLRMIDKISYRRRW